MPGIEDALDGVLVLDLGSGMAPALVTKFLAEAGARVIRLEAENDPFYGVYPAYRIWHGMKEVEKIPALSAPRVAALLARADICVLGGEDFPEFSWRLDAAAVAARHPDVTILNITGYPDSLPFRDRPAAEILIQARSGFCFEHYSEKPYVAAFAAANYGAALVGLSALLGAYFGRLGGGGGRLASVSLFEGVLSWCTAYWVEGEKPDGRLRFVMPRDPHPLIFRCRDGKYIHFVLGSAGSKGRLYRILKIDDPTVAIDDSGFPNPAAPPKYFFGDVDTLAAHVANFDSDELVAAIVAAEVAVEHVLQPGECWGEPQVAHNALLRDAPTGETYAGPPFAVQWTSHAAPVPAAPADGAAPLAGVRVLDFGALVAGPYSSLPLVDLGADVIKVEALTGDAARGVPRCFFGCNRGKRSIAVDMKTPEGAEIVRRLFGSADAVINNYRPGVSARLGMDPDSLQAQKPGIIVLETTGYGSTGPSGQRPGYDMVLQAFCGFEDLAGGEGNAPVWNRTSMIDYAAGLCGAAAVLLALIHRQRTGGGASLRTSLLHAGFFMLSELFRDAGGAFTGTRRLNHHQTGFHPAEAVYQTTDGWIAVFAPSDAMAGALLRALELDGFPPRAAWAAAQADKLGQAMRGKTTEALGAAFESHAVWAEPVLKDGSIWLHDDGLASSGTVVSWRDRKYGDVKMLGAMFHLSHAPRQENHAVPALGADTAAILEELGYAAAQIQDYFNRKIVA
jgi:crotonobetainyl-CoA:carnitine CoA-transferase CaiB-like acyl-CoA transferase